MSNPTPENSHETGSERNLIVNKFMRLTMAEVVRIQEKSATLLPKALVPVMTIEIPLPKLLAFGSFFDELTDKSLVVGDRFWKYQIIAPNSQVFDTYISEDLYNKSSSRCLLENLQLNIIDQVGIINSRL